MCGESPSSAGESKLPLHSKITLLPFGRDVIFNDAVARQKTQASFCARFAKRCALLPHGNLLEIRIKSIESNL